MNFKVIAKRYGDSVEFFIEAADTRTALADAKTQAGIIFGYKSGDAAAPTVALKALPDE